MNLGKIKSIRIFFQTLGIMEYFSITKAALKMTIIKEEVLKRFK